MNKTVRRMLRSLTPNGLIGIWEPIKLRRIRRAFAGLSISDAFERVYSRNMWGGELGEFRSGSGSSDAITQSFVECVRAFLIEKSIQSIADLGCGDFRVGKQFLSPGLQYVGVDIVRPLVAYNQLHFGSDQVRFECKNLLEDPLPPADLAILRQVLQHLSNEEIQRVLRNTAAYRYLIVTEHLPIGPGVRPNLDKPHGPDIRLYDQSGVFIDLPPYRLAARTLLQTPVGANQVLRTMLVERESSG